MTALAILQPLSMAATMRVRSSTMSYADRSHPHDNSSRMHHDDAVQGLMASPSATAGAHLRTLALLCLIVSYDLSWVVRRWGPWLHCVGLLQVSAE